MIVDTVGGERDGEIGRERERERKKEFETERERERERSLKHRERGGMER